MAWAHGTAGCLGESGVSFRVPWASWPGQPTCESGVRASCPGQPDFDYGVPRALYPSHDESAHETGLPSGDAGEPAIRARERRRILVAYEARVAPVPLDWRQDYPFHPP